MTSPSQFRAPGPPALDGTAYAVGFNETRLFGATINSVRSPAQTEVARVHTETPPRFWPRNVR